MDGAERWYPLAFKEARRARYTRVPLEDRVQEAMLAILEYLPRYDEARGMTRVAYLSRQIRYRYAHVAVANHRIANLPYNCRETSIPRAVRMEVRHGLHDCRTLAERLRPTWPEVTEDRAQVIINYLTAVDVPIEPGSDLPEPEDEDPPVDDQTLSLVRKHLDDLCGADPRLRALRDERLLPPEGAEPVTLKSIGERWGVSRERARQLEAKLLQSLRRELAPIVAPGV